MKRIIITGISGTLGRALGAFYISRGDWVIGVTRREQLSGDYFSEILTSAQQNATNARQLLDLNPDLIILNAGQIETEIGHAGIPLREQFESIQTVNFIFPGIVALEAATCKLEKDLDIVAIGSIADGSPSSFGPLYHASKIALHYFFCGVGPIINSANNNIRLRIYRPGAIKGPLAWAPVNRLNESGYKIRARRVNGAPDAEKVAAKIGKWIDGNDWVGTYSEPWSFKIFKYWFALAPNSFYKLQRLGWKKGSKFNIS